MSMSIFMLKLIDMKNNTLLMVCRWYVCILYIHYTDDGGKTILLKTLYVGKRLHIKPSLRWSHQV